VPSDLVAGDSLDGPVGTSHRIEGAGDAGAGLVEVDHGEYFGEDDIVRTEDDFDRSDR
jgi:mannose-6-phosphate isomerase